MVCSAWSSSKDWLRMIASAESPAYLASSLWSVLASSRASHDSRLFSTSL